MKLKNMKKEELEALSYTDLTEMILKENNKPMSTPSIFRSICDLLEMNDEEYTNKIGDYYTSLTTDRRFILLDTAEWDLKEKHKVKIVLDDEEEVDEEELDEDELDDEELEDKDLNDSVEITDDEIDLDDDTDDLTIVSDDELDEEN